MPVFETLAFFEYLGAYSADVVYVIAAASLGMGVEAEADACVEDVAAGDDNYHRLHEFVAH